MMKSAKPWPFALQLYAVTPRCDSFSPFIILPFIFIIVVIT